MSLRLVVGLLGGLLCVSLASPSWAQCTKDTDCKGDRVCEGGTCIAPGAPVPAPAASSSEPAASPAPASPAPATSATSIAAEPEPRRTTEVTDLRRKRHSTGMMVGGIVMVSFVPIALLTAWVADLQQTSCERGGYYSISSNELTRDTDCGRYDKSIYGGLITAGVLMGVGVPLIVIGGKREPVGTARLTPWATPQAGGLSLRLEM